MEANETEQPAGYDLTITLLLAAASRPEGEREQFVREACQGDEALLAAVRKRLEWEMRMKGFLLTPVLTRERMDRPFAVGASVLRGRYRILRVAGEGGMGVVYEAVDEKLDRTVALKCPRFEFRKRLTQEARKSLQVNHPNVCRVFEIHTEETPTGDVDFLTMEFLEGETLGVRMAQGRPGWLHTAEGMEIARQICEGLRAVHAVGIVHRDLKPGNVMLSGANGGAQRTVIMDFGIAQDSDVFHSMRGTSCYLAPELWMGQRATMQSDVYALGVLLHEMEFGRPPFGEATSWRERLHSVPRIGAASAPVNKALTGCLQPGVQRRFKDVAAVQRVMLQRSRRVFLYAGGGLAACGVAGAWTKEQFWPSSPVRLAVLPPRSRTAPGSEWTPLAHGFLHDVSYRFKTLRRARRPLAVFALAQTVQEGTKDYAEAKTVMAATHAIVTEVQREGASWRAAASLVETARGKVLRQWTPGETDIDLQQQLFAMQSRMVRETVEELLLQAEPRRQNLPPAVYADYTQGVYFARIDYENAQRAIPYFQRVIQAAPESALGYAGLAEALLGTVYLTGDQSLHGQALTALEKAEQLDPELAHVHLVRGRLNHYMGLFERARADFQRASELDPSDSQALLGMGWALHYLGRSQEAEAPFRASIDGNPLYYKPYLDAGIFYYELRNLQRAESLWLEAVRLHPTHTRAKLSLAVLYLETDRLAEAERQIEESLKLRRTLPALELLGDLQERQGKDGEAIASYEEALRVGPPLYKTWGALALVYRKVGDEEKARRVFRRGLQEAEGGVPASPREPERLSWCAYYHAALGDAVRARARANDALAVAKSPSGRVRKRVVLAYDLLRDTESALRLLEGAPRELLREISRSPGVSPELRKNRQLLEMMKK